MAANSSVFTTCCQSETETEARGGRSEEEEEEVISFQPKRYTDVTKPLEYVGLLNIYAIF